jgi:hypothetical protein
MMAMENAVAADGRCGDQDFCSTGADSRGRQWQSSAQPVPSPPVRCEQCDAEKLVAFTCTTRGLCPSFGRVLDRLEPLANPATTYGL